MPTISELPIAANLDVADVLVVAQNADGASRKATLLTLGQFLSVFSGSGLGYTPINRAGDTFTDTPTFAGAANYSGAITFSGGGIKFGAQTGASSIDISKHIQLHSSGYGIGITGLRQNYVVPNAAGHYFNVNGIDVASFTATAAAFAANTTITGNLSVIGNSAVTGIATFTGPAILTNHVYNIMASGAIGDGVTNDRSAIQTFLNTLPRGAEVILPANKQFYMAGADLTIPAGITVKAQGALLETPAGVAGGNLSGPAFILDPLTCTIVPSSGVTLQNFKILRAALLTAPSAGEINTAIATWATEARLVQTSGSSIAGAPLLIADTTGITVGMRVFGKNIQNNATVASVVANTSVQLDIVTVMTVPAESYVHFGKSTAIRVPRSVGGVSLKQLFILGFNTAIMAQSGRMFIREIEADCTTIIHSHNAGDAAYHSCVHCIPYYGNTSGTGNMRPGPAYLYTQAVGFYLDGLTSVGWAEGFVFDNVSGLNAHRCWAESFSDGATVTTGFKTLGATNVATFDMCTASSNSVSFDLAHTSGAVVLRGCISATAVDGTKIGHYRLGAASAGSIQNAFVNAAGAVVFVVGSGVGRWKITSPAIVGSVTDPVVTIDQADEPNVDFLAMRVGNTTGTAYRKTALREKMLISHATDVAPLDGSDIETLTVETTAAAGSRSIMGFKHSGTLLGRFWSLSSTSLSLQAETGKNLRLVGLAVSVYGGAQPNLNIVQQASPNAADYVQLGAATGGGGYVIANAGASGGPLNVYASGAGSVRLGNATTGSRVAHITAQADQSADTVVATNGGSRTIPDTSSWLNLTPTGTIAAFTVTMPASPLDKHDLWISATNTITALTLSPNTGQSINSAATTLTAHTSIHYRYNLATTTWFRLA